MRALAAAPPISLGTGLSRFGRLRVRQASFPQPRPGTVTGRGSPEISWRLAVAGRAIAEVWRRRRLPDLPFLVPVSVDLRPKGDAGATFGNCLAFHFARFRPSETCDLPRLASALRQQMVNALRDGQIEANAVAMEFLHYRPVSMMLRELPWTAQGETFSFNCADIGEVPPILEHVFGRRALNAYHVPAVLPRPGVGVFFNTSGMLNNVVVSWFDGVLDADDVERIIDLVRDGMGWTDA